MTPGAGAAPGPGLVPFAFDGAGVRAVVTTRHGGVSRGVYASLNLSDTVGDDHAAVLRNRDLVASALDVRRLTVPDLRHTATVAVVTAATAGAGHGGVAEARAAFPATDALVTDVPGAALAVTAADCTPVLLHDPVRRVVGAAHCGRPGVVGGLLPATIARMTEVFGTDPADLVVGVGPGIRRASYEVGDAEAAAMEAAFSGLGLTEPTRPGHHLLDVPGGVHHQLRVAGVRDDRVHSTGGVAGTDTRTHTDTFFSDRAARPCGRFMAVVVLDPR